MDSTQSNSCLLCYKQTEKSINDSNLDAQLAGIFILSKLLNMPGSVCENLLQKGNPSEWFQCCQHCTEFTNNAKTIYQHMFKLIRKFEHCQVDAQRILNKSKLSNTTKPKRSKCKLVNNSSLVDEIRSLILIEMDQKESSASTNALYNIADVKVDPELSELFHLQEWTESKHCENEFQDYDGNSSLSPASATQPKNAKNIDCDEKKYDPSHYETIAAPVKQNVLIGKSTKRKLHKRPAGTVRKSSNSKKRRNRADSDEETVSNSSSSCDNDEEWAPEDDEIPMKSESEKQFNCHRCEKSYTVKGSLESHILAKHTDDFPFPCQYCTKRYAIKKNLDSHCFSRHGVPLPDKQPRTPSLCTICGDSFLDVKSHTRNRHSDEKKKCDLCDKTYCSEFNLNEHRRGYHYKELNLDPFQCMECDKILRKSSQLKYHIRRLHKKDFKLFCDMCKTGVPDKLALQVHIQRVHVGERDFACELCGKTFFSRHVLLAHVRRHDESTKVNCDECGKTYPGKFALIAHKNSMHSTAPKPFVCELCGFSCLGAHILREHQRGRHYKELNLEPLQCTFCEEVFTNVSTRKHHIVNVHTKEWPFVCEVESCRMGFFSKVKMQVHVRKTHTGEKPFVCNFCNKGFFEEKYWARHLQTHTKVYTFNCNLCRSGFASKPHLERHMKTKHNIVKQKPVY